MEKYTNIMILDLKLTSLKEELNLNGFEVIKIQVNENYSKYRIILEEKISKIEKETLEKIINDNIFNKGIEFIENKIIFTT